MTQPTVVDTLQRTLKIINALMDDAVLPVVTASRPVVILYSRVSALIDPAYLDMQLAAYSLVHFLGVNVGFVSAEQAANLSSTVLEKASVLVVPSVSHISDAALGGIQRWYRNERRAIAIFGNATTRNDVFAFDLRHRKRDPDKLKWLRNATQNISFVDVGGEGGANASAFQKADIATNRVIAPLVRCVSPSSSPNRPRSAFGVFCRSARFRGGTISDHNKVEKERMCTEGNIVVTVMNTLNASVGVSLVLKPHTDSHTASSDRAAPLSSPVRSAFDMVRQRPLVIPPEGVYLAPLEVYILCIVTK